MIIHCISRGPSNKTTLIVYMSVPSGTLFVKDLKLFYYVQYTFYQKYMLQKYYIVHTLAFEELLLQDLFRNNFTI